MEHDDCTDATCPLCEFQRKLTARVREAFDKGLDRPPTSK